MDWGRVKSGIAVGCSVVALGAAGLGMICALRSPLFTVRVVEVADQPEDAPVDARMITALAAVPVGDANLFSMDLGEIERRILAHPWIRETVIQKRFPQTVSISVTFRDPQALVQLKDGKLSYVDSDGMVFGDVDLSKRPDLPILTDVEDSPERIQDALKILSVWNGAGFQDSLISSLSYDADRGFRGLVTYPLSLAGARARAMVDFGHETAEEALGAQMPRLRRVFRYLLEHHVVARQIWLDAGKKIVVRIARGS